MLKLWVYLGQKIISCELNLKYMRCILYLKGTVSLEAYWSYLLNISLISLLGNLLSPSLLTFSKLPKSVVAFEKLGNLLLS